MKRNIVLLSTLLLLAGLGSAQAAAPAASTSVGHEKAEVKKHDRDIRKDEDTVKNDKAAANTERKDRDATAEKLEEDKKAGKSAAVAADKKQIKAEDAAIAKDVKGATEAQKDRAAHMKDIRKEKRTIAKDKAAAPAASTAAKPPR